MAGAGADILIAGGQAAGTLLKAAWTAPSMKIPLGFAGKRHEGEVLEIPPAMGLVIVGGIAVYIWARTKGIKPFEYWTKGLDTLVGQAKDTFAITTTTANSLAEIDAIIAANKDKPEPVYGDGPPYAMYLQRNDGIMITSLNDNSWQVLLRWAYAYEWNGKRAPHAILYDKSGHVVGQPF